MTGGRLILLAAAVAVAGVIAARCASPGRGAAPVLASACEARGCALGR